MYLVELVVVLIYNLMMGKFRRFVWKQQMKALRFFELVLQKLSPVPRVLKVFISLLILHSDQQLKKTYRFYFYPLKAILQQILINYLKVFNTITQYFLPLVTMQPQQPKTSLLIDYYPNQVQKWPKSGKYIMAQFDQESIIVYQAYNPQIAKALVNSQNFHSQECIKVGYSMKRMTWIKPNFLWMMYRSEWATKKDQQRILAISLKKSGFEEILDKAVLSRFNEAKNQRPNKEDSVRLQWDPDHLPNGEKHSQRKAIQLGLRGSMLQRMSRQFIIKIEDITEFVNENRNFIEDNQKLKVPIQNTYPIQNKKLADSIGITRQQQKYIAK